MGHIARRETEISNTIARETKRDNAQMKSIATLTMVCLPLTSVAVSISLLISLQILMLILVNIFNGSL